MQFVTDKELLDIDIKEGLIINKEDGANSWILEAVIHQNHNQVLSSFLSKHKGQINIQAVISLPENEPAIFQASLEKKKRIDEQHLSLLFVCRLKNNRSKYAELLLEQLINQGLSGNDLLQQFKDRLRSRNKVATKK